MKETNRREFLKKGLAGICGAAVGPAALKALPGAPAQAVAAPSVPGLPTRTLGRTGIKTPILSMGTSEATSVDFIRKGYDSGIKLFFSATYYGQGNNERLVGAALKPLPRDSFVVGTAATPDGLNPREGTLPKDMKAAAYMKTAEDSLKRFGLDHVDILLLPFAGKREFIIFDPVLEAMTELKKQGKIRFAGIATHGNCEEALRAAADAKVYDVAMPAYNFRTENKDAMNGALAYAAKAGMGIVAMKTTAGGGGKDKPVAATTALKWVLQNPNIASIVSGMSSVEELEKNLAMIKDLKMSPQEFKDLGLAAMDPSRSLYCLQCAKCVPQCAANLDIPTLMRGYMYAYGYGNAAHARHTLDASGVAGNPCRNCAVCGVACASGFDVKGRVQDVLKLKGVLAEFLRG